MAKPQVVLKKSPRDYAGLVNLGNRVFANMSGNIDFPAPMLTLANLQTAVTATENAITAWGEVGNRGSHADLVSLRAKAVSLYAVLKSLSEFVQNTAQTTAGNDYVNMAAIIATSGFELKSNNNPQGVLQAVQNFRVFISRKVNRNQVKLKWKKPLNTTSAGNVKSYKVYRAITQSFAAAVIVKVTTDTSYLDTNSTDVAINWSYWVVPVNASGDGVTSDDVTLTVPGV